MENSFLTSKAFKNLVFAVGGLLIIFLVFGTVLKIHDTTEAFAHATYPSKVLSTYGQIKVMATPDTAIFNFTYQSDKGPDLAKLSEDYKKVDGEFKSFLKDNGVKENDISVTQYSDIDSSYPVSDSMPQTIPAAPKNYQITESFTAKVKSSNDLEAKVNKIYQEAQSTNLFVTYGNIGCVMIEDGSKTLKTGWSDALTDSYNRASELAKISGLKLGKLVSVGDSQYGQVNYPSSGAPTPYGSGYCPGTSISPEMKIVPQELDAVLNVTYEVK